MEDKQIIKLFFDRAENSIEVLAMHFGPTLYRIAINILENHHDAEESTNDTYLAVWNAIPPATPSPLAPHVYRIGRNTALKRLEHDTAQKRNGRYNLSIDELSDCLPKEDNTLDVRAIGQSINSFLLKETPKNRYVFLRRYWYGDSVSDIAKELRMKENAVSVRLNRLRCKLKEYLVKEGYLYEP